MEQWTRDIPVPSKRGNIYDRNLKELAVSATAYEIYIRPIEIKDKVATTKALSEILLMDNEAISQKLAAKKDTVLLKKKVDADKVKLLKAKNLPGFVYIDDSKRFYPQSNFASYILGFTNNDNRGQDGAELTYEKYLNGYPGRNIKMTDARGQELPDSDNKFYEPQNGQNVVLTIDEVIQHFVEKSVESALAENKAKRVTAIIMDPKTGDILAMAAKPDYDNNDPRKAPPEVAADWSKMTSTQQYNELYKIWRNPAVSDIYEPGSTFKIITSAAALEENVVKPNDYFYCAGWVKIADKILKCWRSDNPHGKETFVQGVQNSCNPVFIEVEQRLGKDRFYKYIKAFGFGTPTGITLPGEASGIVRTAENMGPVESANISFGQGISVTPIQLITAVAAVANDGYLMEPRIAKKLTDDKGNIVKEFEPRVVRQVISKETSATLRQILESVVSEGTGQGAYIPGYKVAAKTGTAQKAENGIYMPGKYVASFVSFAPANDPKVVCLVIIDEPSGASHFGGVIASKVAKGILTDTLRYLDVKPQFTAEEERLLQKPMVKVPNVKNMTLKTAINILAKSNLSYKLDGEVESTLDSIVLDQTPSVGADIAEGASVVLYPSAR